MYKTVCIVTNFRTGSSSFTLLKSEEYGLPYKAEMLSHERAYGLGEVQPRWKLKREKYSFEDRCEMTSAVKYLEQLEKGVPCCFKIMPSHLIEDDGHEMLRKIVKACDKVYYLYRRDFKAQVRSWVAARATGDWGATGFKRRSPNLTIERLREVHLGLLGKGETVVKNVKVKNNGEAFWARYNQLLKNYLVMADLYKEVPGELVCMEDYFSEDKYNPYNRKIIWDEELDIPDFDVEGLFVDNK